MLIPLLKKEQKKLLFLFNSKKEVELTQLFSKSEVFLLACVFEKFIKVSVNEIAYSPL